MVKGRLELNWISSDPTKKSITNNLKWRRFTPHSREVGRQKRIYMKKYQVSPICTLVSKLISVQLVLKSIWRMDGKLDWTLTTCEVLNQMITCMVGGSLAWFMANRELALTIPFKAVNGRIRVHGVFIQYRFQVQFCIRVAHMRTSHT